MNVILAGGCEYERRLGVASELFGREGYEGKSERLEC